MTQHTYRRRQFKRDIMTEWGTITPNQNSPYENQLNDHFMSHGRAFQSALAKNTGWPNNWHICTP